VPQTVHHTGSPAAFPAIDSKPDSLAALEKLGVKIIEGDLDTPASYEPGLKGADNVWINADCECYHDGASCDCW
jgi:hypothetical protein